MLMSRLMMMMMMPAALPAPLHAVEDISPEHLREEIKGVELCLKPASAVSEVVVPAAACC